MIAGSSFIIGAVLQGAAKNTIALLFLGRIFWGIGVGFGDHSAFIYTVCMHAALLFPAMHLSALYPSWMPQPFLAGMLAFELTSCSNSSGQHLSVLIILLFLANDLALLVTKGILPFCHIGIF